MALNSTSLARSLRRRHHVMIAFVIFGVLAIVAKLIYIQVLAGPALAAEGEALRTTTVTVEAPRGDIVDRNGQILATSADAYNVVVDQVNVRKFTFIDDQGTEHSGAIAAAKVLAPMLEVDAPVLAARLAGERRFVYLAKGLTPAQWQEISELDVSGVFGEKTSTRLYPAGTTAGSIIGWVGAEGKGLGGLELMYDEYLSGTPGQRVYEQGRRGQQIPMAGASNIDPIPGNTLTLTLDRDLQWKAQELIDESVRSTGAKRGSIVIQDTTTFEILAMADSGAMDPNDPTAVPNPQRASRSVTEVFEPGSTAKVITMAAALELGLVQPLEKFEVDYTLKTSNGQVFRDSSPHGKLQLTAAGIFAKSSNTGTIMIGERIPTQVRHDYLKKFGLGESAELGIPGETRGLLIEDAAKWDGRTKYAVLFGQGLAVNAVQNVSVFSTIANGGLRLDSSIVKPLEGQPVPSNPGQQVVSEKTAQTVMQMLEGAVTEGGTGTRAQIPGYRIAGKTGTAQAADEQGQMTRHVASFAGVAPADNPQIAVVVTLIDPKTSIYGGTVAAPVFQEITGFALQHLGIKPSQGTPQALAVVWE